MRLSHLDGESRARMVDVSTKAVSARRAVAEGRIELSSRAYELVVTAALAKGDVLTVAEVAGVMAAKQTSGLVPLCHPVALDKVEVVVTPDEESKGVLVRAMVRATATTGVEMEALVAVSVACLTVYDMVKSADRAARITGIRVLEKSGGSRGDWRVDDSGPDEGE